MTTDKRIEKMEGQLARMRWFNRCLIACIGLSLGGWFIWKSFGPETAWAKSVVKEIRANKFILEDENGKIRAGLYINSDGPQFRLWDENGKPRATMSVFKDGPGLRLFDENGKPRAGLVVFMDGPGLRLFDENGKPRAKLGLSTDGTGLVLYDENGKVSWSAP